MNSYKNYVGVIGLILLCFSCNSKETEPVLKDFSITKTLSPIDSINIEDYEILKPSLLDVRKDLLVFKNLGTGYNYTAFNPSTSQTINLVEVGQGPGEVVSSLYVRSSNNEYHTVYDLNKRRFYKLNLDSIYSETILLEDVFQLSNADMYFSLCENDYFYIGTGILQSDRFAMVSKKDFTINYQGEYPDLEVFAEMSSIQKAALFSSSRLVPKPDNTKMAFFMNGMIEIFDIDLSGNLSLVYKNYYYPPNFTLLPPNSGPVFKFNKENIIGFQSVDQDDNFIYAIYSDKPFEFAQKSFNSDYFLIYDWNGKSIKGYKLDKSLIDLSVRGNKIYGLSYEGEPKVYIYEF